MIIQANKEETLDLALAEVNESYGNNIKFGKLEPRGRTKTGAQVPSAPARSGLPGAWVTARDYGDQGRVPPYFQRLLARSR